MLYMKKSKSFSEEYHELQDLPGTILFDMEKSQLAIQFIMRTLSAKKAFNRERAMIYDDLRKLVNTEAKFGMAKDGAQTNIRFNSQRFFEIHKKNKKEYLYVSQFIMNAFLISKKNMTLFKELLFIGLMRQNIYRTILLAIAKLHRDQKFLVSLDEFQQYFINFTNVYDNLGDNPKYLSGLQDLQYLDLLSIAENTLNVPPYKPSKEAVFFTLLYHSIEYNKSLFTWEELMELDILSYWMTSAITMRDVLKELNKSQTIHHETNGGLDQYVLLVKTYDQYKNWFKGG